MGYGRGVSEYYEETIEDEGGFPLEIRLPLSVLEQFGIEPDFPGLEEPLTYTLGKKEETVWEEWEKCGQSWQDCLELIQSVRVLEDIPPDIILQHNLHMLLPSSGVKLKP